jgi:low affinity Fe/Cu permease
MKNGISFQFLSRVWFLEAVIDRRVVWTCPGSLEKIDDNWCYSSCTGIAVDFLCKVIFYWDYYIINNLKFKRERLE